MKKTYYQLPSLAILFLLMIITNGRSFAQNHIFDWVHQVGGNSSTQVSCGDVYKSRTLAVDKKGNIYNVGSVNAGVADFNLGGNNAKNISADSGRLFIAKYRPDGALVWVKQFGSSLSGITTNAVDVDASGNVYMGGYYRGAGFDLNPGNAVVDTASFGQLRDIFIIKLDSSGNYQWGKTIGDAGQEELNGLAVSSEGDIYATGVATQLSGGKVDFDPDPNITHYLEVEGCYVLKLNTNGVFQWVKGIKNGIGRAITIDNSNNILITGDFGSIGKIDFNPGTNPADTFFMSGFGSSDIFVAKLNSSGSFIWARQMGGKHQDQGFSIATDALGSVYATGIFADTADFDPMGHSSYKMVAQGPNTNTMDAFIVKFDSDGHFRWARQTKGQGSNWGYSLDVGEGRAIGVYVAGTMRELTEFGSDTLDGGAGSTFLTKLDTSGNFIWAKRCQVNATGTIILNSIGDIYTSGSFYSSLATFEIDTNFSPYPVIVNKVGLIDGFVLKLKYCSLSDTIVREACGQYVYDGKTYYKSGEYTVNNPEACYPNSVRILDLTIYNLNPTINVDGFVLSTVERYDTYQWLLNGSIISGATDSIYQIAQNGAYQVIVSRSECIDTSAVYQVNNYTGINDMPNLSSRIRIHPNPTTDKVYISSPTRVHASLCSIEGRVILEAEGLSSLSLKGLSSGIYLLRISDLKGNLLKVEKVIKE